MVNISQSSSGFIPSKSREETNTSHQPGRAKAETFPKTFFLSKAIQMAADETLYGAPLNSQASPEFKLKTLDNEVK